MIFSQLSGQNNPIFGKWEAPITLLMKERGEAMEQEDILKNIFSMEKSSNFGESLTGLTAMQNWQPVGENGEHPEADMQAGYTKTLEHMTWKSSFAVSREMIEDTKSIDLRQRPTQFVTSYYRTRQEFGARLLGGAAKGERSVSMNGKTFSTLGADGEVFFSKSHPSKVYGANQSNCFSDAFSAEALGALETVMQNFRGDNDNILDIAPAVIVIPNDAALKDAVFAAIGSGKDPDSGNNKFNYLFGRWEVQVWPYLNKFITANSKPWILMDRQYNDMAKGALWLDRTEMDVSSEVKSNDALQFDGFARFTAGFNDWRAFAIGGVTGGDAL